MKRLAWIWILALVASACSGSPPADPSDAATRSGRDLFEERILGPNPGCITCHSLDPETTLVGPSLAGVAVRAGTRLPEMTAEAYLRQSITDPSAFVVDGFDDGKMPADWAQILDDAEIDALVSYLLTLDDN